MLTLKHIRRHENSVINHKPLAFADKLAVLLDGYLATGDYSRTNRELLTEANNESIKEDVDNSSLYESIESESVTHSLPQLTTRSTTMLPEPSRARTLATVPSNLRKRFLKNAVKAELRRKKSGPHSLADAITDAVRELSTSREALVEGNKEPGQRVASILVSGEFNLTNEEQVTVFSAIKKEDMIDLFLTHDKDGRKRFVEKVLARNCQTEKRGSRRDREHCLIQLTMRSQRSYSSSEASVSCYLMNLPIYMFSHERKIESSDMSGIN
jgi:hypothetical protein